MKKLTIMRGLSGAGKSTYVQSNFPNAEVFSADQYFFENDGSYKFNLRELGKAHTSCKHRCAKAMARGAKLVVVDNTNSKIKEMKPYLKLAKEWGYEVEVIRISCDVETAIERNTKNTPTWVIRRMADRFVNYPNETVIK